VFIIIGTFPLLRTWKEKLGRGKRERLAERFCTTPNTGSEFIELAMTLSVVWHV